MKLSNELLRETAQFVERYMQEHLTDGMAFHKLPAYGKGCKGMRLNKYGK